MSIKVLESNKEKLSVYVIKEKMIKGFVFFVTVTVYGFWRNFRYCFDELKEQDNFQMRNSDLLFNIQKGFLLWIQQFKSWQTVRKEQVVVVNMVYGIKRQVW